MRCMEVGFGPAKLCRGWWVLVLARCRVMGQGGWRLCQVVSVYVGVFRCGCFWACVFRTSSASALRPVVLPYCTCACACLCCCMLFRLLCGIRTECECT